MHFQSVLSVCHKHIPMHTHSFLTMALNLKRQEKNSSVSQWPRLCDAGKPWKAWTTDITRTDCDRLTLPLCSLIWLVHGHPKEITPSLRRKGDFLKMHLVQLVQFKLEGTRKKRKGSKSNTRPVWLRRKERAGWVREKDESQRLKNCHLVPSASLL